MWKKKMQNKHSENTTAYICQKYGIQWRTCH